MIPEVPRAGTTRRREGVSPPVPRTTRVSVAESPSRWLRGEATIEIDVGEDDERLGDACRGAHEVSARPGLPPRRVTTRMPNRRLPGVVWKIASRGKKKMSGISVARTTRVRWAGPAAAAATSTIAIMRIRTSVRVDEPGGDTPPRPSPGSGVRAARRSRRDGARGGCGRAGGRASLDARPPALLFCVKVEVEAPVGGTDEDVAGAVAVGIGDQDVDRLGLGWRGRVGRAAAQRRADTPAVSRMSLMAQPARGRWPWWLCELGPVSMASPHSLVAPRGWHALPRVYAPQRRWAGVAARGPGDIIALAAPSHLAGVDHRRHSGLVGDSSLGASSGCPRSR